MKMKHLKILAVDSEYLIGMDIERILTDELGCTVTVLTPKLFSQMVPKRQYDVAVIEGDETFPEFSSIVTRARSAASHLVFSTADAKCLAGVPGYEDIPVVMKPFDSECLVSIVAAVSTLRCDLQPSN
jgi:hypothetical protein